MAIRVLLGALLTAIVLFFWGWIYWAVTPMSFSVWKAVPAEREPAFLANLKQTFPDSAVVATDKVHHNRKHASRIIAPVPK